MAISAANSFEQPVVQFSENTTHEIDQREKTIENICIVNPASSKVDSLAGRVSSLSLTTPTDQKVSWIFQCTIKEIVPIPGNNYYELIRFKENGWMTAHEKGQFKCGDLTLFVPWDHKIDVNHPNFAFIKNRPRFSIDNCPGGWYLIDQKIVAKGMCSHGVALHYADGFEQKLKSAVIKYSKPFEGEISNRNSGNNKPFPIDLIEKTDEKQIRSNPEILQSLIGKKVNATEKLDGSSMTFIRFNGKSLVCSRNLILFEGSLSTDKINNKEPMLVYAKKYHVEQMLAEIEKNLALQGEFIGPKINGNCHSLEEYKFYIFRIKDIDNNRWLGLDEMKDLINKLPGLEMVPIVETFENFNLSLEDIQERANNLNSQINGKGEEKPAEGLVICTAEHTEGKISAKVLNENYKIEEKSKQKKQADKARNQKTVSVPVSAAD